MENMKSFTCPACSWTVRTPYGENDIYDHATLHARNHHPEMKDTPREDLEKLIKDE